MILREYNVSLVGNYNMFLLVLSDDILPLLKIPRRLSEETKINIGHTFSRMRASLSYNLIIGPRVAYFQ